MKAFLSYSSSDYELAKEIKDFLDDFGIDTFLAHTSIEPTRQWEEEIYRNLTECDIFIPLLTHAFKTSNWTDQESGIAYSQKKKVIPISVDLVPYGFLGKYQAMRFDSSKVSWQRIDEKFKIIDILMKDFPKEMRNLLISSLDSTYKWRVGTNKFKILKTMEPFTKEEINNIIKASSENNQIYEATDVPAYLKELLERYTDAIEPKIAENMLLHLKS
jgi:hypothetical protein